MIAIAIGYCEQTIVLKIVYSNLWRGAKVQKGIRFFCNTSMLIRLQVIVVIDESVFIFHLGEQVEYVPIERYVIALFLYIILGLIHTLQIC